MRNYTKCEAGMPFGAYRVNKKYLKAIEDDITSLVYCVPCYDLYCGPVLSIRDDEHNCNIDYYVPVIEDANNHNETFLTQLTAFKNGKIGNYNFSMLLPCTNENLTPAKTFTNDERTKYDYFNENQNVLKTLAEFVYKHADCSFDDKIDIDKYNTSEVNVPFGAYHINQNYLKFLSESNSSGIRCRSDHDLYCGPAVIIYDKKRNCNIGFYIPVMEPDIPSEHNLPGETWATQVEMYQTCLSGGYDYATMLPCLSKYLTPASNLNAAEQTCFDYFDKYKDYLTSLADRVYTRLH